VDFLPDSGQNGCGSGETMTKRVRRNHSPAFKAKVALAAMKGKRTLVELAQQFDIHVNQITQWKALLLQGAAGVFGSEAKAASNEWADGGFESAPCASARRIARRLWT